MYGAGFYEAEHDGVRPFRWMETTAVLRLPASGEGRGLYFAVGNPSSEEQPLTVTGRRATTLRLPPGWSDAAVTLDDIAPGPEGEITLSCPHRLDVPGETRRLTLMVGEATLGAAPAVAPVTLESGFYGEETDGIASFRWMRPEARIAVRQANPGEWLLFSVKSPSVWPEELHIADDTEDAGFCIHILPGEWQVVGAPLALLKNAERVRLSSPYVLAADSDSRTLSFMVADVRIGVPTAYEKNSAIMHREVFKAITTESYPTCLACDTSAECNLRCSFCVLDKVLRDKYENPAKGLEKISLIVEKLLPLASKIQPYITGEPFFRDDIWTIIEKAERIRQERMIEVEVSTNALLLKGELAEKVLRSCITSLLVTVNAGTAATYKRLCGGDFATLKSNLLALRESPLRKASLVVSLSFVLMRENMEELPAFVRLAQEVGADAIQIWPLNSVAAEMGEKTSRDGFVFNYRQQMPRYYPRVTRIMLEKCLGLADALGVRVGNTPAYRMDDAHIEDIPYPIPAREFSALADSFDKRSPGESTGQNHASGAIRKCYFPWSSMYFTTEGDFAPCMHLVYKGGIANIASDDIESAWNGEAMRRLRRSIMSGEVDEVCRDAQCPFVSAV